MVNCECPACGTMITAHPDFHRQIVFYECPICGRFELNEFSVVDSNYLAPYLAYNRFPLENYTEYRYHTTLGKEKCDQYKQQFDSGDVRNGWPVHMDEEMVKNWYPKTFSERIDRILLYLGAKGKHIGQYITLKYQECMSVMFIDRYEYETNGQTIERKKRESSDCEHELTYILQYLEECAYIDRENIPIDEETGAWLTISPKGYARIDELQKNTAHGRNVLVAMKFGDETKPLREAIRKGISDAGYIAIFIDEVQHNELITPELLKYIRDSKFVVADLTHQNNGAYFEEGYAMGLGKPVIQLCKQDTKLHFDIAQKNTIMWATEDDIPEMLTNRIKATID